MSPRLARALESEELLLYPQVKRKIEKYGLEYYTAYTPQGLPLKSREEKA